MYFHGPAYQVLASAWRKDDDIIGELAGDLPDNHTPPELPLATRPRLVELCFQTAGAIEMATSGRLGLPARIERVVLSPSQGEGPAFARLAAEGSGAVDVEVVDKEGRVLVAIEGYATEALPQALPEAVTERLRKGLG